ncbi:pilus assembly PilX N-terminal domain-containing protein [Cardiobacteriaceae bacterium TAE3-ERU3]|nr:pilus assembly PilX N-terminal domain-containing protein [Cardiobacteriaceae bacterium TAE3-ERU3]
MYRSKQKQTGAILFVVLMILIIMSILVIVGVNRSKNNMVIGLSQAQQVEAFDQAEAMLGRVRFALEQVALPPGIAISKEPDYQETVIWTTPELAAKTVGATVKSGINEPLYGQPDFPWDGKSSKALTCPELSIWLKRNNSSVDLSCEGIFGADIEKQPKIFIEFITKSQTVTDIDSMRGAYFYRITILGKGFLTGRNIVQGVTGVQYI